MRSKALTALVGATIALPGIAAAEFNYSYFEGSFVDVEIDDTSVDGDGLRLEGSTEVADNFFVRAEYADYDFDFDIDGSSFLIGGGYFHQMSDTFDFIATGSYHQVEVENFDDDGIGIGGGVRLSVGSGFEIDATLNWVDLDDTGSDTYVDLRGRYAINDRFAATLKFDIGSDTFETMGIGIRYNFRPVINLSD
jgi:hypothetical protein